MIDFYCDEGLAEPQIYKSIVRSWLTQVAERHGRRVGSLCYQFCGDERILEVNREFLQHDYYTDIITFDESRGERIAGDMLISLDTVKTNAELIGVSYAEELHRVLVHGVLHLCGYGDKTELEEQRMRQMEDEALELLRDLLGTRSLLKG
ncbi:MAG: rRNA maturation RNase YbeY [Porphyromonas sp.]|nr:rRNA maturation RNase YbeY [Porphyromonas sp.]